MLCVHLHTWVKVDKEFQTKLNGYYMFYGNMDWIESGFGLILSEYQILKMSYVFHFWAFHATCILKWFGFKCQHDVLIVAQALLMKDPGKQMQVYTEELFKPLLWRGE